MAEVKICPACGFPDRFMTEDGQEICEGCLDQTDFDKVTVNKTGDWLN